MLQIQLRQLDRLIALNRRPNSRECFFVIFSDYPSKEFLSKLFQESMTDNCRAFLSKLYKSL